MNIPQIHKLSRASQFSLLAIVILLGGIFFTVNSALQEQNSAGHASIITFSNIFIRGTTHASNTGIAQLTLTTPTSVVAGDVLIAHVVVHHTVTTITAPSGWTLIRRDNTATSTGGALYKRIASGVDSKTYTWKFSAPEDASGGMVDLANVDTTNPIDATSGVYNYSTAAVTAPSVTTTTKADFLLFFAGIDGAATVTVPSGMNAHWTDSTAFTTSYLASQHLTTAGATGTREGQSSSVKSNIAQLVALKPSSIIVPPPTNPATPTPTIAQHPTATPTIKPPTPTPTVVPPGGNLLKNPSFENGTTSWNLTQVAPAVGTFTTTTGTAKDGVASALITVTTSSTSSANIQLKQGGLPVVAGQTYLVSFWAKASASRTISTVVKQSMSPFTVYVRNTHDLTTSWQQFSYTFSPTATSQIPAFIGFNMANAAGMVWIDEVNFSVSQGNITPPLTPSPTKTPNPTVTPPGPTNTPIPGDTVINVTVGLHGIGTGGDSANPGSQGNMNPLHPSRTITADIYDSQNQLVVSKQGTVTFDVNSGKFQGAIDLGTNVATGLYTVKIKTDQYLRALVSGIQTITSGQVTTLPTVTLVAGDINGDNAINIVDYNILIGCYSDLLPPTNCPAGQDVLSDITDDGHVNQFDYNLFLRELTNIGGQ